MGGGGLSKRRREKALGEDEQKKAGARETHVLFPGRKVSGGDGRQLEGRRNNSKGEHGRGEDENKLGWRLTGRSVLEQRIVDSKN